MTASQTLATRADELAELIEQQLGVRGRGLEEKLRKAGRLLPRWVQDEAKRLVQAQALAAHPKLAMQTDIPNLERGLRRCEKWLKSLDPSRKRKDRILGLVATNAANFLIVGGLFVAYLVWAGHL